MTVKEICVQCIPLPLLLDMDIAKIPMPLQGQDIEKWM